MSDAARRTEAVRDGIAGVTPSDGQVARILARAVEAPLLPLGDQLFQRLLRHRIVFLGQQVDDDIANRICAELVLLAAEDASATSASTSTRRAARSPRAWPSTT